MDARIQRDHRIQPPMAHLGTPLLLLILLCPASEGAIIPSVGDHSVTQFCGTVLDATWGMTNYGVTVGQPYLGSVKLTHEPPENPNAYTLQWDCATNTYGCGTFHLQVPGYVPPQHEGTSGEVDITGPIELVRRSSITYRVIANVDDFVVDEGPARLGATGDATLTLLCQGCPDGNPPINISPDFRDNINPVAGILELHVSVPGVGGSLAPPPPAEGQGLSASVVQLGGACNNFLPTSSPWGLVGLVGLLIASSIFVGGRPIT